MKNLNVWNEHLATLQKHSFKKAPLLYIWKTQFGWHYVSFFSHLPLQINII